MQLMSANSWWLALVKAGYSPEEANAVIDEGERLALEQNEAAAEAADLAEVQDTRREYLLSGLRGDQIREIADDLA